MKQIELLLLKNTIFFLLIVVVVVRCVCVRACYYIVIICMLVKVRLLYQPVGGNVPSILKTRRRTSFQAVSMDIQYGDR